MGIFPSTTERSFWDGTEETWKNAVQNIGECLAQSTWKASCTSKRWCWMEGRGMLEKDSSSVEFLGSGSASKGNPAFVLL